MMNVFKKNDIRILKLNIILLIKIKWIEVENDYLNIFE